MKRLTFIAILLTALPCYAQTWLTVSVGSKHLEEREDLRESNPGLGVEHELSKRWRAVLGAYRNSIDEDSVYAGATWIAHRGEHLRLGLTAGVVTGYRISPAPMLLPTLMLEGKRFGLNVIFIPPVHKEVVATVGLQLKGRF